MTFRKNIFLTLMALAFFGDEALLGRGTAKTSQGKRKHSFTMREIKPINGMPKHGQVVTVTTRYNWDRLCVYDNNTRKFYRVRRSGGKYRPCEGYSFSIAEIWEWRPDQDEKKIDLTNQEREDERRTRYGNWNKRRVFS